MLFHSFSCLITLAENSSITLNKSEESKHPCLMPDFRSAFCFLPLCVMLGISLAHKAFNVFVFDASIPGFLGDCYCGGT